MGSVFTHIADAAPQPESRRDVCLFKCQGCKKTYFI